MLTGLSPEQNQGLLAAASQILQNSGPSRQPYTIGQALGTGIESYQGAMEFQRRRKLQEQEAAQMAQMRALQMRGIEGEIAANNAKANAPVMQEFDTKPQVGVDENGKPFQYLVSKTGEVKRLDGVLPRDKAELVNLGGKELAYNPYALQPGQTFQRTVSPDSQLSAATSMRGQNMTDARARDLNALTREGQQTQVVNDPVRGMLLVDKRTGVARPATLNGQGMPSESEAKREASAKNLLPLITQADKLIEGATGSYLGAAHDQTARFFGRATDGAKNIAQLRVLEGNLMMAQPRMEGPQSNTDVQLYRQMAAQIGDPTVPAPLKKAALGTLRELYKKYDSSAASAGNGSGGWSIQRVD